MYDPMTLAFGFPPYRSPLYRLKRWIGFDIWHVDPERPGSGQRTDDSCGWFDRRPREYADAVAYVLKDVTTMHDVSLALSRRKHMPMPFYEGISEPRENPDRAEGYPRLTQADALALTLMLARELENRRWWNGADGKAGSSRSWLRRTFTRRRNVNEIAFDLALSPIDNLSSIESAESMVRLIAAALHRQFKPWWKHPRWHVHHWRLNFDLWRNVKRMFQRCAGCGKRLGFGYSPTTFSWGGGGPYYHGECARDPAAVPAQGTEAGTAETEGLGPKDDGPVPEGNAP